MPTYRIDRPGMDLPRVVVAAMPQAARLHVANSELVVRRIEVDEAFELAGQGVLLERAGEEAPTVGPDVDTLAPSDDDFGQALADEEGDGEFDEAEEPDPDRLREDHEERRRLLTEAGDEDLKGN